MMYLADFSVIKPDFGLIFWSTVIFLLFWGLIGKLAFKPIKDALKNRETDIKNALDAAEEAKREVSSLKSKNDDMIREAQAERSMMLQEAKQTADRMVEEAKDKAKREADKMIANAKQEIAAEKQNAMHEIRNQVGTLATSIAEQVLVQKMDKDDESQAFIQRMVDQMGQN